MTQKPTRNNHYVPVGYQRGFCLNFPNSYDIPRPKLQIYILDKNTGFIRLSSPDSCFMKKDLYTVKQEDGKRDDRVEDSYKEIDRCMLEASKTIIDDFISDNNYRLYNGFKESVAYCMHQQITRTLTFHNKIKEEYSSEGHTEESFHKAILWVQSFVGDGKGKHPSFSEAFLKRTWYFFHILSEKKQYICTDNPVSFKPSKGFGNVHHPIIFAVNEKVLVQLQGDSADTKLNILKDTPKHFGVIDKQNAFLYKHADRFVASSNESLLKNLYNYYGSKTLE